jgi:hypothetical protein
MLSFTVHGLGHVAASATITRRVAPSEEVIAHELREDFADRLYRAVITAAREARERGEVLDVRRFDIEVVQAGEL